MARTTIAVDSATRDALTAVAVKFGNSSLDETLRALLFEHECTNALARLADDPAGLAEYHAESQALAEADSTVYGA